MSASLEEMRQRLLTEATSLQPSPPPTSGPAPVEESTLTSGQTGEESIEDMRQRLLGQVSTQVETPSPEIQEPRLDIQASAPPQEAEQGLGERVNERVQTRNTKFLQSVIDAAQGEITPGEVNLRLAGNVAGSFFDALGEGMKSAATTIGDVLPDDIKKVADKAIEATKEAFLANPVGQAGLEAVQGGIDSYKTWKGDNPRAAENLEAAVNVGLLLAPAKVRAEQATPTKLSKVAETLKQSSNKKTENFVKDLVMPEQTKKVKEAQTGRTTVSPITGKKVVQPTTREAEMIKAVSEVPGIKKPGVRRTVQEAINKTDDHLKTVTASFEKAIEKTGSIASQKDITNRVSNAIQNAQDTGLFIVGEGKIIGERLKRASNEIIARHSKDGKITGSGILQARREIDQLIRDQKPNTWNANVADTAATQLAKTTRNELNDILEQQINLANPSLKVKEGLNKQSVLIEAMENMRPKAAVEANDLLGRAWQNVAKATRVRSELVNVGAVLAGTTALGMLTQYSAALSAGIAAGAVGMLAGRAVMSRTSRNAVAAMVKGMDDAINQASKVGNKAMVQELRIDRAAVIELLQNTDVVSDEDFEGITVPVTQNTGAING